MFLLQISFCGSNPPRSPLPSMKGKHNNHHCPDHHHHNHQCHHPCQCNHLSHIDKCTQFSLFPSSAIIAAISLIPLSMIGIYHNTLSPSQLRLYAVLYIPTCQFILSPILFVLEGCPLLPFAIVCPLKSTGKNLSKLPFLENFMRIVISGHHPPPFSLSSMGFYHRMRFIIEDRGPHRQPINHHHHHQDNHHQHHHLHHNHHYQDEVHHRGPWSPELCQEERFQ